MIGWVGWAFMALSLVVEAIARLRRVQAPQLPGLGRPQAAARGLIGLAALAVRRRTPRRAGQPRSPQPPRRRVTVGHVNAGAADQAPAQAGRRRSRRSRSASSKTVSHTVKPGESLWAIAEQHLGDGPATRRSSSSTATCSAPSPSFLEPGWVLKLPALPRRRHQAHAYTVQPADTLSDIAQEQLGDADRYMEIYDASTGITQPGGAQLTDPDVIDVGWTLNIPGAEQRGITTTPGTSSRATRARDARRAPRTSSPVDPPAEDEPPVAHEPEVPEVPETAAPDAPPQAEEPTAPAADVDQVDDADDSILDAPWVLAGLTGGGVLLSGALLMALQTRRRASFRNRRPGRAIAAPAPELAPVEMTMTATGAAAAATVEFTDEALRRLAAAVGAQGTTMPPLAAVELGARQADPAPERAGRRSRRPGWAAPTRPTGTSAPTSTSTTSAPTPGTSSRPTRSWSPSAPATPARPGCSTARSSPPSPSAATPPTAATSPATSPRSWPSTRGRAACRSTASAWRRKPSPWTSGSATTRPEQPGHPRPRKLLAAAVTTVDRATRHDTDVSTARTGSVDDDVWPARMLLLDAAAGDPEDLEQLLQLVNDHVGQSATSIVVAGERPNTPGAVLHMTNTGRVILEHAGLNLIAVGLTSDEARGCALVYAQSDVVEDVPVPVDETATDGWEAYTDQSGALRREHTLPRNTPADAVDEPLSSLLEGDDEDYIRESAIVQEDLETLAPKVPAHVRAEVEQSDPTLDQDIADWFSTDCDRPRLSLLGPVTARTHGKALAKRKPYFTELLAFLALHRKHGATREEICEAFGITPGKARDYTNIVRDWLGTNPTHRRAPPAPRRQGAGHQGPRRQRLPGRRRPPGRPPPLPPTPQARARPAAEPKASPTSARPSSWSARRPFSQLREDGWSWLANERDRVDLMAPGWIADVALIVVTEALATGDLVKARSAAYVANLADPDGESTRLCLAHVTEGRGRPARGRADPARGDLQPLRRRRRPHGTVGAHEDHHQYTRLARELISGRSTRHDHVRPGAHRPLRRGRRRPPRPRRPTRRPSRLRARHHPHPLRRRQEIRHRPRRQRLAGRARRRRRRTPRAHRHRRQPAISHGAAQHRRRHRMRKHHSALGGVALALALTLTGCSDDGTDPEAEDTPPLRRARRPTSTAPTPKTPEEKAAAQLAEYLDVRDDSLTGSGTIDFKRLNQVATGEEFLQFQHTVASMMNENVTVTGEYAHTLDEPRNRGTSILIIDCEDRTQGHLEERRGDPATGLHGPQRKPAPQPRPGRVHARQGQGSLEGLRLGPPLGPAMLRRLIALLVALAGSLVIVFVTASAASADCTARPGDRRSCL